jgi:hypothetical protein
MFVSSMCMHEAPGRAEMEEKKSRATAREARGAVGT